MSTSEFPASSVGVPRAGSWARAVSPEAWTVGLLVAVAVTIRIVTLDNQSLWADEALTAYDVSLPFGAMLHTIARFETTPPLYFVLVWGWVKLFGTSDIALRSLSAIAGVALVPIVYLAARDLISRRAGLIAAALVVVNPFMIWYSQEARAYMLLATLTGASFLYFVRAREDPSWRNLSLWAGFSAAAVMTHFFAGFAIAPEALWLLWTGRSLPAAAAVTVVAVAQVAMLPFAVADASASHGVGWIGKIPALNRISTMVIEWGASNLYRRSTRFDALVGGVALAAIVLLLVTLGADHVSRRGAAVATAIAASVLLVPLALVFVGQDYFLSRNEMPAFVPVIVLLAAACAAPRARLAGGTLTALLLVLFSVTAFDVQTHPYLQRPDWRAVARSLGPATVPRAIIAADSTTADPLKIYLPGVKWVQSTTRRMRIGEIDIVGATKRMGLRAPVRNAHAGRGNAGPESGAGAGPATGTNGGPTAGANAGPTSGAAVAATAATPGARPLRIPVGRPVPRSVAPTGATLLARYPVANWVIARFMLVRPERLSIRDLARIAPRFFRRTPIQILIFTQPTTD